MHYPVHPHHLQIMILTLYQVYWSWELRILCFNWCIQFTDILSSIMWCTSTYRVRRLFFNIISYTTIVFIWPFFNCTAILTTFFNLNTVFNALNIFECFILLVIDVIYVCNFLYIVFGKWSIPEHLLLQYFFDAYVIGGTNLNFSLQNGWLLNLNFQLFTIWLSFAIK